MWTIGGVEEHKHSRRDRLRTTAKRHNVGIAELRRDSVLRRRMATARRNHARYRRIWSSDRGYSVAAGGLEVLWGPAEWRGNMVGGGRRRERARVR